MTSKPKACKVETIDIELECSRFTPGAYWVYGCEYYAVKQQICLPQAIANRGTEEAVLDWIEYLAIYGDEESSREGESAQQGQQ